ncbi:MAG TPA: cysteine desulfurase [Rhodopirellula baltica]|uniref:NifS-like aminotranfserase-putative cysteine desulfurase n=1 Tax=Rhodopirellula baltica (strain DSM 10527 / NCIMB 13988 / SH1) TaxID=243090 RepID=Q7ULX8_RHOBA|nr:cysteine desulfurase family protein [Rhodopirellula baltica]CAD76139.1 NifS-like aminotranfserase-putative cysteine desulfurase [Rhodopirellula baltica SH 1]HBE63884.1 cysteine desulfurase [Rhodopirellula baltica]
MIYLDHHATTPCDPRVVEAMLPYLTQHFGNPHSDSHEAGREVRRAIDQSIDSMAAILNAPRESVVITSGATESINLAIRGVLMHPRCKRHQVVVCETEHPAVLEVADDLSKQLSAGGQPIEIIRVGVHPHDHPSAGQVDLVQLRAAVNNQTALVSIMWANNEIGSVAPIKTIAEITHEAGALLHCDATQAVGRLPVDALASDVDLLTASAHKFYGPKSTGFLVVGNGNRRVRLRPQIVGGGQQRGLRGGTLNPASIVAMATALRIAIDEMESDTSRILTLRELLWGRLHESIDGLQLNGANWHDDSSVRLPGNLNVRLRDVEGEAWMAATPEVAFSSGSACSSTEALPSHVLLAMGLTESEARRSVRFGVGRFNTADEINSAADQLIASHQKLVG